MKGEITMRLSHLFNLVCVAIISYNMGVKNQKKRDLEAAENSLKEILNTLKKYTKKEKSAEELIFRSRNEAEDVLSHITTAMENYGFVTLADVKELIGAQSCYTDNKYGWTDLKSARIRIESHYRPRYVLVLPNMQLLK